jgi:hypothetical protein
MAVAKVFALPGRHRSRRRPIAGHRPGQPPEPEGARSGIDGRPVRAAVIRGRKDFPLRRLVRGSDPPRCIHRCRLSSSVTVAIRHSSPRSSQVTHHPCFISFSHPRKEQAPSIEISERVVVVAAAALMVQSCWGNMCFGVRLDPKHCSCKASRWGRQRQRTRTVWLSAPP